MRLASLYYRALRVSGLTALARRLSGGGVVLCYHNVVARTDAPAAGGLGLHMPLATFERQMRWLAGNYDVVPLAELVGRVERGGSLRGRAAVTFDDGYRGVFDHAWPLLRALRLPATVFLVAEAPGREAGFSWDDPKVLRVPCCRPAGWESIAQAARSGLELGAHSATHPSLPALDERALLYEVVDSRAVIERHTGVTPEFFAYPYGLSNEHVRHAVRSAGYRAAFTLGSGRHGAVADPWALPRVNVPAGIEDAAFQAWAAGLSLRRRNGL